MTTLTLAHSWGVGDTPSVADIENNWFDALNPGTSAEVLNGWIQRNNYDSSFLVGLPHTKRGVVAGGKMVGGTTNLDYPNIYWEDFDADPTQESNFLSNYQPIPRLAITFYLPFDVSVLRINWVSRMGPAGYSSATVTRVYLRYFFDENTYNSSRRISNPIRQSAGFYYRIGDYERSYNGHYTHTEVLKGWHTAYVGMAGDDPLVRVRVGNISYFYIR